MVRILKLISILLAVGALTVNPLDPMESSHGKPAAGHMSAAGSMPHDMHGTPDGSHDDTSHHGVLHCVTFHCVTPFLAQAGRVGQRVFDPAAAVFTVIDDDKRRAAFLERDPPIPRLFA